MCLNWRQSFNIHVQGLEHNKAKQLMRIYSHNSKGLSEDFVAWKSWNCQPLINITQNHYCWRQSKVKTLPQHFCLLRYLLEGIDPWIMAQCWFTSNSQKWQSPSPVSNREHWPLQCHCTIGSKGVRWGKYNWGSCHQNGTKILVYEYT
jgi:hypothetical protein